MRRPSYFRRIALGSVAQPTLMPPQRTFGGAEPVGVGTCPSPAMSGPVAVRTALGRASPPSQEPAGQSRPHSELAPSPVAASIVITERSPSAPSCELVPSEPGIPKYTRASRTESPIAPETKTVGPHQSEPGSVPDTRSQRNPESLIPMTPSSGEAMRAVGRHESEPGKLLETRTRRNPELLIPRKPFNTENRSESSTRS